MVDAIGLIEETFMEVIQDRDEVKGQSSYHMPSLWILRTSKGCPFSVDSDF